MTTEQLSAPIPERRKRRPIRLVIFCVGMMLFLVACGVATYRYTSEENKDANARDVATAAAFQRLTQLSGGTISKENNGFAANWIHGRVDQDFKVGNCHQINGYLAMAKRPAKDGAVVHIFVVGNNAKAPAADVRVGNQDDFLKLTRTLNSSDSGLKHCVAGEVRLQ